MAKSDEERERERVRRLRDQRLQRHDPGAKIKGVNWDPQRKEKPKPMFPFSLLQGMPARVQGAIIGLVLGLVIFLMAVFALPGELKILSILAILLGGVVGMIIGAATDQEKW
jgi:hypothetical protein